MFPLIPPHPSGCCHIRRPYTAHGARCCNYAHLGSLPPVFQVLLAFKGVVLTTHPLLASKSRMSIAIPLLPLWALGDCYRANIFIYTHLHLCVFVCIALYSKKSKGVSYLFLILPQCCFCFGITGLVFLSSSVRRLCNDSKRTQKKFN
jgi:hypothetical protein